MKRFFIRIFLCGGFIALSWGDNVHIGDGVPFSPLAARAETGIAAQSGMQSAAQSGAQTETARGGWQKQGPIGIRLVKGMLPTGQAVLGLDMMLAAGWRTYWKYPGASGIRPHFDWSGSAKFRPQTALFAAPYRFHDESGDYYGYAGRTLILIPITPMPSASAADAPSVANATSATKAASATEADTATETVSATEAMRLDIRLNVELGICRTICVPVAFDFHETATPADFTNAHDQFIIKRGLAALPQPAGADLQISHLTYDGLALTMVITGENLQEPEISDIIIAGNDLDVFERPLFMARDKLSWLVSVPAWAALDTPLIGRELEIILRQGDKAVMQRVIVSAPQGG